MTAAGRYDVHWHAGVEQQRLMRAAEIMQALYEQGRVKHAHPMIALEDQMLAMTGGGYAAGGSPDRLDAAVWAISDLMGEAAPGIIEYARLEAAAANAPRASVNDASTFTATLLAPAGISTVHLMSGRSVSIPADRLVTMTVEDSKPLIGIGWIEPRAEAGRAVR